MVRFLSRWHFFEKLSDVSLDDVEAYQTFLQKYTVEHFQFEEDDIRNAVQHCNDFIEEHEKPFSDEVKEAFLEIVKDINARMLQHIREEDAHLYPAFKKLVYDL